MPNLEEQLVELERRFQDDGIAYLLVQFVDIHGAPKVKLVPASTLRSVAEVGAGFAGGAVWGMGQGPHSHDLQARADLGSYTRCHTNPASRGSRRTFTSTASRIRIVPASISIVCSQRAREKGYLFNVGIEPEFFLVVKNADGSIRGWDPHQVDDLAKPCYDYKGISGALGFLRELNDGLAASAGASISPTTKTPISSTRSTFDMPTPWRRPID